MVCGEERCWVPICTTLPYFFCAYTSSAPSAGLWLHGFSTYTCLPACSPAMAIGVCQWSGLAMLIASTSFCARILRKSFSVVGADPISRWVAAANFSRILLSTSHTYEMQALCLFALSEDRWA